MAARASGSSSEARGRRREPRPCLSRARPAPGSVAARKGLPELIESAGIAGASEGHSLLDMVQKRRGLHRRYRVVDASLIRAFDETIKGGVKPVGLGPLGKAKLKCDHGSPLR